MAKGDDIKKLQEATDALNAETGSSWTFTPGEALTGEQTDPRDEGDDA
ncbi:hypothetical protein [Mangrovactinospora gilvigrisea]|nr:hypothetical protein [Mangrovactinospora gilvigrisea]